MGTVKHKVASGLGLWLMKRTGTFGFTSLWGTIYYLDSNLIHNKRLRAHEMTHIEQMERDGKFVFSVKYLWNNLRYGYENNPYEIEARARSAHEKG